MLSIGKLGTGQEMYYLEKVAEGAEDYCSGEGEVALAHMQREAWAQGTTVDRAFVAADPSMDKQELYVATSRSRGETTIYATPEVQAVREAIAPDDPYLREASPTSPKPRSETGRSAPPTTWRCARSCAGCRPRSWRPGARSWRARRPGTPPQVERGPPGGGAILGGCLFFRDRNPAVSSTN